MLREFNSFIHRTNGSIATTIGVIAVPLMICLGTALDYARLHNAHSGLQDAADAASLASAKELGLASTKDETVKTIANDYAVASIYSALGQKNNLQSSDIKTTISKSRKEVTVDISHTWTPMIIQYFDSDALPIKVSSTASLTGEQSICVLALDPNGSHAIDMVSEATMTANNCVIYSNSAATNSISVFRASKMNGSEIMSSGGYNGPDSSFFPLPLTDTPVIEDPLKGRTQINIPANVCQSGNEYQGRKIFRGVFIKKSITLRPGIYCGGLNIRGSAVVTLEPGEYIIKDGPLLVQGNSSLVGNDVGFFLTGSASVFEFGVSTQAILSARKSGVMSGILFFEDRNSPSKRQFIIKSKDAEKFEGAIYLPQGTLEIDKASKVGQRSSWTAIVARRILIGKGPNIIINSDYANSTIPVPDGIGGGTTVSLKR